MAELYVGTRFVGSGASKTSISSATVVLDEASFVYDGTTKTQGVSSITVNGVALAEGTDYTVRNNSKIDAGDYTLYIDGKRKYEGTATASWSIAKATGSVSVSPSSVNILGISETATVALTVVGDGEISVSSSDTSVATVERNNDILTVTSVGDGNATVTVTLANGMNYTGDSATIGASVLNISSTLSDNTPEQIQAAAQAGIASSLWSIGAMTAAISIGAVGNMSATSACAFIIGFNHNSSIEGTGIHFQFGKTTSGTNIAFCDGGYGNYESYGTWFNMNNSDTNSGGWSSSRMRTVVCPAFLTALPTAWQNVISTTTKYSNNTGSDDLFDASGATSTNDKIFLLAEWEVYGARSCATSAEQDYQLQYDYYKNGNSKIKYQHNLTGWACFWWLRSPHASRSGRFCRVHTSGDADYNYAYYSYGFAPAFVIG